MYNHREKAQRDYEWALMGAREEGREEGRVEGREEGRAEGRAEGREAGEQFGVLKGKIQVLQDLLGDTPWTDATFQACNLKTLTSQLAELQQRLRDRQA